eukprot:15450700-Alexandrium_andersonii.AAC.1
MDQAPARPVEHLRRPAGGSAVEGRLVEAPGEREEGGSLPPAHLEVLPGLGGANGLGVGSGLPAELAKGGTELCTQLRGAREAPCEGSSDGRRPSGRHRAAGGGPHSPQCPQARE